MKKEGFALICLKSHQIIHLCVKKEHCVWPVGVEGCDVGKLCRWPASYRQNYFLPRATALRPLRSALTSTLNHPKQDSCDRKSSNRITMSSSAPRSGERMIHQDFIARIRFSNALPPPPNPPKLLEIPNTGLASGQYTMPGFASRLAREQPLNIEADAELGMPLDLVGMPGVFDGDERCELWPCPSRNWP